jgi:hypothetical protein
MRQILVYGNSDKRPGLGFPTSDSLRTYIKEEVFSVNNSRYRYTQGKEAQIIVLSRDGLVYGHFEIAGKEAPTVHDRAEYPPVTCVYVVVKSALYSKEISLADLDITGIQFGKYISEEQFQEILRQSAPIEEFSK